MLPRWFLATTIHTKVGKPFKDFVDTKIAERDESMIDKNNLGLQLRPEILKALQESTQISTKKGRSHHLLKRSTKVRFVFSSSFEHVFKQFDDNFYDAVEKKNEGSARGSQERRGSSQEVRRTQQGDHRYDEAPE